MTPAAAKASYRRALNDVVTVRRYTGTGPSRPHIDAENIRARVVGYQPQELVGTVLQGDSRVIVYADDLIERGFALPVTTSDKVMVRGNELAIIAVDGNTRRVAGVLIAYELQVRG